MIEKIPQQVSDILTAIQEAGSKSYIVGGCVRDLILGRVPKDWDITTGAKPKDVQKLFSDSFYENEFGTVGVKVKPFLPNGKADREHDVIEITTFRIESKYSDKRRPDQVKFAKTLAEDLARRDFTINAIALEIRNPHFAKESARRAKSPLRQGLNEASEIRNKSKIQNATGYEIIDPYEGEKDIRTKIIRTVGDPQQRFDEDALRMMRAVRFYAELGFSIEEKTLDAIRKYSKNLESIAQERIKDEFSKIILSKHPSEGIDMLQQTRLLPYIIPELEKGIGMKQNRHHIYTIYQHSILSLKFCPSEKLETRLAALFHDIAKPQTKRGYGLYATFYNHDQVGARVVEKILRRLTFSNEIVQKVKLLVNNHMFYYNPDEVKESSVRRLIQKVGFQNIGDLLDLRISDRLGSGVPKAKPYKLRHLEYVIDKVSQDAVSVKMLKINGNDLMVKLKLEPGPKIGAILDVLLAEVIEDAGKNNPEKLLMLAEELKEEDLKKLRQLAKEKIEERKEEDDQEIKKKHWVK